MMLPKKRPAPKFKTEDTEKWLPFIFNLALRNLPIKHIAGACGCSTSTLKHNEEVQRIINEGHATHRFMVENELWLMATIDPSSEPDPIDRAAIRTSKVKALQILKHSIERKEEFTPPAEGERLRRLSDEDLAKEIKLAAEKL